MTTAFANGFNLIHDSDKKKRNPQISVTKIISNLCMLIARRYKPGTAGLPLGFLEVDGQALSSVWYNAF